MPSCGKWPQSKGWEAAALHLAGAGCRILAIATGEASDEVSEQAKDDNLPPLEFLGLVAFIDPLRPKALEAVRRCRETGIEVAIITGDHPATASAIARELNLPGAGQDAVTGADLDKISDHESPEFDEKIASTHIFARVSPLQKLHIVEVMGLVGFAVWWFLLRQSQDESHARNLLFLFIVLFQNFHVFNCRSEKQSAFRVPLRNNPMLIAGVGLALGLQLLAMQLGFMQDLLRVAPVSLSQFFTLLLLASSVLWTMELFKWQQRLTGKQIVDHGPEESTRASI